jgi:hypothetical protein
MAKSINLDFSKFFPSDQAFVAVKATARNKDDFYANLIFGDGENKVSFFLNEYTEKETLKRMQVMIEAFEKTMEFLQKASQLPSAVQAADTDWLKLKLWEPNSAEKKPAAKKKAPAKKKAAATK